MKSRVPHSLAAMAVAIFIALVPAGPSSAEEDGTPVPIGAYRSLHSSILNEERTLLVNTPVGYDETEVHYPVLFVLYGGGYFAESVHIVDRLQEAGLIPQLLIVGVKNVDRYRDNLPVDRRGGKGGAEDFLKFFTDELIPFVEDNYRTKDFRILLGPQAVASFSLYALMERPGLFNVNIITNPFWNRSVREYFIARAEDFFTGRDALESFFFVTCNTADDDEATMDYLGRLKATVESARVEGFTMLINRQAEAEARGLIPSPGLKEGLMEYFKGYAYPEDRNQDGLEDIRRYYEDLSKEYGYEIDLPEKVLVRQGDRLQRGGDSGRARILFEYVAEHYPSNLDCYHRLAELHRASGEYERAIDYYEAFVARRREPFIVQRMEGLRKYVNESAAYAVERAMLDSGTDAGRARYEGLRADSRNSLYFDESEFNSLGYSLIARNMLGAAIEVFKMNVEMNPESANAYDSLGEAYMLNGETEPAADSYRKSLELDPENANAVEKLNELGSR